LSRSSTQSKKTTRKGKRKKKASKRAGSTEAVVKHTPNIDTPPENGILDDEEEFRNPFLKLSLKLPNEDLFI